MEITNIEQVATYFVDRSIGSIYDTLKENAKSAIEKRKLKNKINSYIEEVFAKNIHSKSYFFQDEPNPFYEFYVPLDVSLGKDKFPNFSYLDVNSFGNLMVLVGLAGSGKTLLMRHLFLGSIESGEKIPIFLELRDFNSTEKQFREWILSKSGTLSSILNVKSLEALLEAARIVLFCDGYDEVSHEKRVEVSGAITEISNLYPNTRIILSSRPDDVFSGWHGFTRLNVRGLDKKKAVQLLDKLPHDETAKMRFLKELKNKLFVSHASFLRNPLLLTIMLITYGKYADIPSKRSVFYNQAFEALFQKHDAAKGLFKRPLLCELDILDYTTIFSSFSIQTYIKRKFRFNYTEAFEYVKRAANASEIEVDPEDFLEDSKQGINMLVDDGMDLSYSHRSFQEFFVAKFISGCNPRIAEKLLEKFSPYCRSDGVFDLVSEMNLKLIEECAIIPAFNRIFEKINLNGRPNADNLLRHLKLCWTEVGIDYLDEGVNEGSSEQKPTVYATRSEAQSGHANDVDIFLWCSNRFKWGRRRGKSRLSSNELADKHIDL